MSKKPIAPIVLRNLDRLRPEGLSDRALSLAAGLSDGAVSNMRKGDSQNPRADTLAALARAIGCTVEDLLDDTEDGGVRPPPRRPKRRDRAEEDVDGDRSRDEAAHVASIDVRLLAACAVEAERLAPASKKHDIAALAYERFEGQAWTRPVIAAYIRRVLAVAA